MARILVVDDEPHVTRIIGSWLEQNGHRVVRADNGQAALDLFEAEPFELLVTDVGMPELDGLGLLRALSGKEWPRGVIVLTARHDYEALAARHRERHIRLMPKPFSPRQIAELVEELLALGPAPVCCVAAGQAV